MEKKIIRTINGNNVLFLDDIKLEEDMYKIDTVVISLIEFMEKGFTAMHINWETDSIYAVSERLETDEEFKKREKREFNRRRLLEEKERKELLRLKAKYGK